MNVRSLLANKAQLVKHLWTAFLCHALANALEHGGAARQHDVTIKIFADVCITLDDALEHGVVNVRSLLANKAQLVEHLWTAKTPAANSEDVAIWQFVSLLLITAFGCSFYLNVKI